ncbi:DUF3231 family protein [Paenibacillus chondroitinus]|uniref:DUF3231 family protein n=1 Tax=Paenibacillus chondroitinus TaxID=59842 RepID=A0ABU6D9L3_9BACL|nr:MULTISPECIES: DUF3231 family protein [Paenibacillus]MCY9659701.1 DUF3231 family protein [Paenibacillus anseongense]MEB4794120.1 DUF3231 family protein [Paenibacillus chondroitinus]
MTNILETVLDVMKTLVDNEPKPPLHIGEAMTCWTYLTMLEEEIASVQIGLNTTTDIELLDALHGSMEIATAQSNIIRDFMLREGVSLPPVSEKKPQSDPLTIPMGVKLTDDEIANALSIKVVANYMMCATGAVQSVRNDVGFMFASFQAEKLKYGASLKTLMRKRGWMKIPPYYVPNGLPTQ